MRKLVVGDGTRERELQLVGRIVVGRDPVCDISHEHSLLSRRHAEFVTADGVVTVRDLGSRNGIFVNGVRTAQQVLEPGDVVQVGPLRARYLVENPSTAAAEISADADSTAVQTRGALLGSRGLSEQAYRESGGSPPDAAPARMPSPAFPARDDDHDETKLVVRKDPAPDPGAIPADDEAERTWMVTGRNGAEALDPIAPGLPSRPMPTPPPGAVLQPPVDVSARTILLPPRAGDMAAPPALAHARIGRAPAEPMATPQATEAPGRSDEPQTAKRTPPATVDEPRAPTLDQRAIKSVVLIQLLIAVAVVAAAGAVPFMILRAALSEASGAPSMLWLALPVVVGIATAIVVSGRIATEVADLMRVGNRKRT